MANTLEDLCWHLLPRSACIECNFHKEIYPNDNGVKSNMSETESPYHELISELKVGDEVFAALKIKRILIDSKGKHYELQSPSGWGTVEVDENCISPKF